MIAELRQGRSPVAIWADLVAEDAADIVCPETIYQALYSGVLDVKPSECLRSRRRRRRGRQARHERCRPASPNIAARPAAVNERVELGHWEADQIIAARNRSSLLTLTERVTRYAIGVTMPGGPHSPWQRGQVENQNRTWRWWSPRGTDLAGLDPAHVNHVGDIINNQRRRHLDYHSPAELYAAASTVH